MHMNCYVCECGTHFAINSLDDVNGEDVSCPNCGEDAGYTGEVVVNPNVMGENAARNKGFI